MNLIKSIHTNRVTGRTVQLQNKFCQQGQQSTSPLDEQQDSRPTRCTFAACGCRQAGRESTKLSATRQPTVFDAALHT